MSCQHCGAKTTATLCHPCTDQLRALLQELASDRSPGLLECLADAAAGGTSRGDGLPIAHRHPTARPPGDPKAAALLSDVHAQIAAIAAQSAPDAANALRWINTTRARILKALEAPEPRHRVGDCDCGTELRATQNATQVACRHCGIVWQTQDLERQQIRASIAAGTTMTKPELLTALAIIGTPATHRRFKHWRESGQLKIIDYRDEEPLYRPADIFSDAC